MSNKVLITNSQKAVKVPSGLRILIRRACNAVLEYEHFDAPAEISVTFVDNAAIAELNNQYRNKPMPTDVLSFPTVNYPAGKTARGCEKRLRAEYDPELGACLLGDIVISYPRALEQAAEYGHSARRELCYLLAHGLFHLMGYDHMTEAEKPVMRAMEEKALASIGLTREE